MTDLDQSHEDHAPHVHPGQERGEEGQGGHHQVRDAEDLLSSVNLRQAASQNLNPDVRSEGDSLIKKFSVRIVQQIKHFHCYSPSRELDCVLAWKRV